jgi:hypothetical protein
MPGESHELSVQLQGLVGSYCTDYTGYAVRGIQRTRSMPNQDANSLHPCIPNRDRRPTRRAATKNGRNSLKNNHLQHHDNQQHSPGHNRLPLESGTNWGNSSLKTVLLLL